jgi:hypothetical protein
MEEELKKLYRMVASLRPVRCAGRNAAFGIPARRCGAGAMPDREGTDGEVSHGRKASRP